MYSKAITVGSSSVVLTRNLTSCNRNRNQCATPSHRCRLVSGPVAFKSRPSNFFKCDAKKRAEKSSLAAFVWAGAEAENLDIDYDEMEGVDIIIEVHETAEKVGEELCKLVAKAAKKGISKRAAFTLAIPGGSVAKALAPLQTYEGIEWDKVHLFFVNERCPEQKNFKLALETFVTAVGIPLDQVYTVTGTDKSPEEEAQIYEERLLSLPAEVMKRDATGLPRFDMVLIGMGADGHVGSIYPNSKEATSEESFILGVSNPDKKSITFSLPLMNAAETVIIAATGQSKAPVVKSALEDFSIPPGSLPGGMVDPTDGVLVWLLDEAAGSLLEEEDEEEEEEEEMGKEREEGEETSSSLK
uniref:Glucosamine/galactosamine-6-phosphate isomerase domain-containing protein n=1 Tax=Polyblepharides amylifera TaxID=1486889 RepID=A0A7R9XN08_9CHLO|mmetsp:Transcript_230/g.305  ORF Transcript_230/g.305 Transcript_230/m.305 type:complete len:357 (+) Transcript_230:89-1159(+)